MCTSSLTMKNHTTLSVPPRIGRPHNEFHSQNFSFAGLRDLTERQYEQLRQADPQISQELPFCALQHHINVIAHATILDRLRDQGENRIPELSQPMTSYLPPGTVIPAAVHEYLT